LNVVPLKQTKKSMVKKPPSGVEEWKTAYSQKALEGVGRADQRRRLGTGRDQRRKI